VRASALAALAAAAGLVVVACGRRGRDGSRLVTRDSVLVLGPGDMQIINADGSVEMALVGKRIVVRFSERTMAQVRRETDTAAVKDSGLGGSIERLVKSTVQSALAQQVEYSLSDLTQARYDHGEIELETGGRRTRVMRGTRINGKPVMQSFRPDDAERFVAAVNARRDVR